MKYFDTHTHLNFPYYNKDRAEVIEKTLKEGIFIVNIGTDIKESKKVVEIAERYKKGVYSSVGLHPLYIEEGFDEELYEKLASYKKTVAIGETGLDYKYLSEKNEEDKKIQEKQKEILKKHIRLSVKLDLPLVLHCRMAHDDLINILKSENQNGKLKGVVHCFTGSKEQAKEYIDLGFYLGINGIIFKMNLGKVIEKIPLKEILLETDAPFLSTKREIKRNSPLFVEDIAKEIARIKKVSVKEVAEETTKNAKELFNI